MRLFVTAALVGLLAACGGGGDGDAAAERAAQAQGRWTGTTGSNRSVTGLVLADGAYYMLYSSPGYPTVLGGVVLGEGTAAGSAFTSSDALHLNLEGLGALRASLSGTVAARQAYDGTILSTGIPPVTFSSTYEPEFEQAANLSSLAGSYSGQLASAGGKLAATLTLADNGAMSVSSAGCTATGALEPRPDGNAFDMGLVFGPAPCPFPGQALRGIAFRRGTDGRFFALAPNADRSDAAVLTMGKL
jgi:hypothetical protein